MQPITDARSGSGPDVPNVVLLGFVLLIGLSIRVIGLDQPFVDAWSWRQSDVAMVARNFYQFGYDLLYPRLDYGGAHPGYVGMEFPTVPFTAALLYPLFGEHEAVGRAISVVFFLLSVPALFFLVRMEANRCAALVAICAYSLMPLTIFAGRSFTSDMAAHSFSVWAVWLFAHWVKTSSRWRFFACMLATAAAVLTKAPYALVGLPMAYCALRRFGTRAFISGKVWLFGVLALAPAALWYYHEVEVSRSNYPYILFSHVDHFFTLRPVDQYLSIARNILLWLTPAIVLLAVIALALVKVRPCTRLFLWWCMGMAVLIAFAGYDNYLHSWYQLPLSAPAAALAGIAVDWALVKGRNQGVLRSRAIAGLAITLAGLVGYQSYSFLRPHFEPVGEPLRAAGQAVDRLVPEDSLILFASWGDPTTVYYSRRRGWLLFERFVAPSNAAEAISMLEMRRREGAAYFVATSSEELLRHDPYSEFWNYLQMNFRIVASTPEFTIFRLGDASGPASL